jgi:Carboxypeptidase regulatory-like domain
LRVKLISAPDISARNQVRMGHLFGAKAQEAAMRNFLSRVIRFGDTYPRRYPANTGYHSRITLRVIVCLVMSMALSAASRAQTATGQFNGHVYDQNGAVVPDASVSLEDTQTHVTRTTKTNGEGLYQFPLIAPGEYTISVTQTGFQTATSPNLKLDVNQIATQDFKLEVGATSQTVSVTATTEMLQASTANLGAVVEQ